MIRLEGKIVLVTGGGSGIGKATALTFAKNGALVAVVDVDITRGEESAHEVIKAGSEAVSFCADVGNSDQVKAIVDKTVATYGRLDCACNNAGISGVQARTADCTEENWDRIIRVNLKGVWLCMKYEIPKMLAHGRGAIVNIASVAGLVGLESWPAYVASKHGVVGLTKSAALEYAKAGIRINAVCPSIINTPMAACFTGGHSRVEPHILAQQPLSRMGTTEEVAEAVVWLCSDGTSFVTGHALPVDGGLLAH